MREPTPGLDAIRRDPDLAKTLAVEAARDLFFAAEVVAAALRAAVIAPAPLTSGVTEDRLLDVHQAAERLGVSPDWIYRRSRELPFVVRVGSRVRASQRGIDRWIRSRTS
jgi:predicted DNA-binding transcriptional regulator AlpA